MKTITIGIMPQAQVRARILAIAKGEYKPKDCTCESHNHQPLRKR